LIDHPLFDAAGDLTGSQFAFASLIVGLAVAERFRLDARGEGG
jgi:hypothetical protein